jgi:hypothetical protein
MKGIYRYRLLMLPLLAASSRLLADSEIGRVYHPYVEPMEREIEWRSNIIDDSGDSNHKDQKHWLAAGYSINDRWFAEAYVIAAKDNGEALQVEGFELEAKLQLTEQGEYWADWGVLYELERETSENIWEAAISGLMEKEIGPTSLAANLSAIYEFGGGIDDEFETAAAFQWRWRYAEKFEPAIEYYQGDDLSAVGPVGLGMFRIGRQKLKWELGLLFGVDNMTPDRTCRVLFEYEY